MSFVVSIRQHADPIIVEPGDTVLASALAQGVAYPFGCQSGNCGACKSHLDAGEVTMEGYSEFALSDEEKARGLILACRAVPWEDCEVAWLDEDDLIVHPRRLLACKVVGLDDATHDIKRVRLAIESGGPFDFSAGQFASRDLRRLRAARLFDGQRAGRSGARVPCPPHRPAARVSAYVAETAEGRRQRCASRARSAPPTCARAIAGRSSPSPAARAWRRSSRSSSARWRRSCRSTSISISASAPSATSICTTISRRWRRSTTICTSRRC